jgi:hypothetical protein
VARGPAPFVRDDIALVVIDDLPPLALGLIWSARAENAKIRALADAARSLGTQPSTRHADPLTLRVS